MYRESLSQVDVLQVSGDRSVLSYTPTAHEGVEAVESTTHSICFLPWTRVLALSCVEGGRERFVIFMLACQFPLGRIQAPHRRVRVVQHHPLVLYN